jgi:flavin reductase (DIM6/NTAB) family NADH-FMN oxidoreductase RutF
MPTGRRIGVKVNPAELSEAEAYKLLASVVVPRPIAWISTIGKDGVCNAAPFSFFTAIATKPPIVGVSIGLRRGAKKDTLRNIENSRDFVVNLVTLPLAGAMNITAVDFPPTVDEISEVRLTAVRSDKIAAPRIAESPVAMECRLLRILILGQSRHRFVLGEVVQYHLNEEVLSGQFQVDALKLNSVGRLSGSWYCRVDSLFELPRLNYSRYVAAHDDVREGAGGSEARSVQ